MAAVRDTRPADSAPSPGAGVRRPSQLKATKKALRTRRQILESSVALFRERGFDATSMRDIASRAGLSLGSTYYYFESKQALVFDYYVESQEEASQRNDVTIAASTSFDARLRDMLEFKLDQMAESRSLVVVLARTALDPAHPLSPFSPATKQVRDQSIEMLRRAIEGSDLKVHKDLLPHLPRVLWLYRMGIIFFWIHDRSPEQRRTRRVVDASLGLLGVLLPLTRTRLPGVRKTVRLLAELLGDLEFWEGEAAAQP